MYYRNITAALCIPVASDHLFKMSNGTYLLNHESRGKFKKAQKCSKQQKQIFHREQEKEFSDTTSQLHLTTLLHYFTLLPNKQNMDTETRLQGETKPTN